MRWFFGFFLVSGFCGLVYQVVWLRLAMASFGVTTPLISLIVSLFMAGLGIGSWATGRWVKRFEKAPASTMLRLYGGTELLIGLSAVLVPTLFGLGRRAVQSLAVGEELGSGTYYMYSGLVLAVALLPWTLCMGATFPLAMSAIRKCMAEESKRSFSFLYLANVLGAVLGTLVSAFVLIELLGFRGTLYVAMGLNWLLALVAFQRSTRAGLSLAIPSSEFTTPEQAPGDLPRRSYLALLFLTGLSSMGMEVVWVRQFTPYLGTVVYAFAVILAIYLVATFVGSQVYRMWAARQPLGGRGYLWILVGCFGVLPLVAADFRLVLGPDQTQGLMYGSIASILYGGLRVAVGIVPLCAAFGFLTPMLVDRWSGGDPDRAGSAYAVNVFGSLLGPLLAGFLFLPWIGVHWSLFALAVPLFAIGAAAALRRTSGAGVPIGMGPKVALAAVLVVSALMVLRTRNFEEQYDNREVRHDATATSIAIDDPVKGKQLLINGFGITQLTPVTKMMAHLPLAWRGKTEANTLALCFGMGTTFRSLRSWDVPATVVELVPSVPELFTFFHADGDQVAAHPDARIVIDDARRFLERTGEKFDIITIDPPPPVEAAGSSLLYSVEFYDIIKSRLTEDGILQQWCPGGEDKTMAGITYALLGSFPHVRVFMGMENWGFHFLCSMSPLPDRTPEELAAMLSPKAVEDMLEWGPSETAVEQFRLVTQAEIPRAQTDYRLEELADPHDDHWPRGICVFTITDDRPQNEYYFLRRLRHGFHGF